MLNIYPDGQRTDLDVNKSFYVGLSEIKLAGRHDRTTWRLIRHVHSGNIMIEVGWNSEPCPKNWSIV